MLCMTMWISPIQASLLNDPIVYVEFFLSFNFPCRYRSVWKEKRTSKSPLMREVW
jgi:hypothetical protein